jgi:Flp pilus assembly protein TadB
MSYPYWDGLSSPLSVPPAELTGIDRENWLRGKKEAEVTKAALEQQREAEERATQPTAPTKRLQLPPALSWNSGRWVVLALMGALLGFFLAYTHFLAATVAGWLLFAAAVLLAIWRLAAQQMASNVKGSTFQSAFKNVSNAQPESPHPPATTDPR